MLKIGVITIPDFNNYGNRLQNYALHKALKKLGHNPVSYVPYKPNILKKWIRTILGIGYKGSLIEKKRKLNRLKAFLDFDKKYLTTTPVNSVNYSPELSKECDCFISGSDQIWNPKWYTGYAFLDFVRGKKKFSYAASFGCDQIPMNLIDIYRNYLSTFDMITVREKSGHTIVKNILQEDVNVVPDPTFALTAEEWKKIEKRPHIRPIGDPYVLLYFLGGTDEKREKQINALCNQEGLSRCVNVLDYSNSDACESGPAEFIYLINHAECVMTDSFHACVFSILFHKKFVVFERLGKGKSMNNRIVTLLEKFALEDCMYHDDYVFTKTDSLGIDRICATEQENIFSTLETMINKVGCHDIEQ